MAVFLAIVTGVAAFTADDRPRDRTRSSPTTTDRSDDIEAGSGPTAGIDDDLAEDGDASTTTGLPAPPNGPATTLPAASSTVTTPSGTDPSGRRWVPVGVVKGTRNASSAAFALAGVDTRLVYRSGALSLRVYLVDEAQGRDATAGFADLECDAPCDGEMILVPPAGSFHLEAEATGAEYEISIEEYRRPA